MGAHWQDSNDQGATYVYGIQEKWTAMAGSTGETRSHFATGLTNGLEHTFAVRAVNDDGASGPSNQASAEPEAEASAPAKPRYFSAVQVGAGEVRLEWEPSADPLTIVRFDYTDDGTNWKEATGSHSTTVSYTVSDLMDTTYTFAVRAVNSAGEGVSSDPWSVTIAAAPDRPTALTAVAGDEQVELSWRYSDGQTSTTGFQYQQKTEGDFGDDWTDVTGSTWTTRSHIVTGLTNDIPYTFRIRAVNVTIASAASDTVTSTSSAAGSRPARPANFNAEQTGVGQVELTWDMAEARLTVTGYQYTADGGSSWTDISGSDSGTVYHTVTGLTTGDTFTFAVRAVNSGTLPGLSSVSRGVTIVGEPGRPTGVSATGGASDGATGDQFGHSVAMDGATVVVGARRNSAAYAFIQDSGVWSQAAKFTASDSDGSEEFGSSVAVRGGTIVIGAPSANVDECDDIDDCDEDPRSGAAYLFTKPAGAFWANDPNEDNRKESGKLILPAGGEEEEDDQFGNSVALDGQSIVIGVPAGNDGFGSVYVSDIPQWAHIDDSKATTVSHRVTDLENGVKYTFQVRAVDKVSDVGAGTPSDIARATPLVRNHAPEFGLDDGVTLTVDEKESPGNYVGSAVTATDPDEGDTLVYSLSGTHASSFRIDASNGQIAVGSGTTLDYESGLRKYSIIVSVNDGLNTDGDQDNTNDDSIKVTINVNNVDEDGSVSLSSARPRVNAALTASLTDPDGSVSDTSWQWARSANGSTGWRDIVGANSYRYRPVANDGGNYLRATASYTDGHGSGKEAAVVSTNRVRSLDRPGSSPPSTPTPVPITVVPPGVGDATVPPGLLLVIGLMGMLLVIAGSIVVRERRSNSRL